MNHNPTECNLCGGNVEYVPNLVIYGKPFGSGFCYRCTQCHAYVGTYRHRPKMAMGILANKQMRKAKMVCHRLFDTKWRNQKQRTACYRRLASELGIKVSECHFGYFDLATMRKAYALILKW